MYKLNSTFIQQCDTKTNIYLQWNYTFFSAYFYLLKSAGIFLLCLIFFLDNDDSDRWKLEINKGTMNFKKFLKGVP
jgi:hypothetical protein